MTQQNPSLTSRTISAMRFPLAVMVVFIHSRMISDDYAAIDWGSFSGADVPAALQVLLSTIVSHVAVPAFYVMSGYLFFLGVKRFGRAEYVAKCRKRVGTLLVPYLLWNAFALLWTLALKLGGVVVKGKPFSGVVDYLREYASLSTFWDCKMWALERANWIGQITPPHRPDINPDVVCERPDGNRRSHANYPFPDKAFWGGGGSPFRRLLCHGHLALCAWV